MTLSNIIKNLRYPLIGWVAGVATILVLGWIWPAIFPGIARPEHYDATDPGMLVILGIPLLIATPAALIGGFIGSRLPREGGPTEQMITAAFMGALFTLPFGCYGLWVFSGY
jgi:hypothetical protein